MQEITRVGLIGDVHGEDKALEAVLFFLKAQPSLDAILCTGDLPGKEGIGDTNRCCELLQADDVLTIRGNHDRWFIENEDVREMLGMVNEPVSFPSRAYIASLPKTRTFDTPVGSLMLCHGVGTDDMAGIYPWAADDAPVCHALKERRIYGWYRILIAGHTHKRLARPAGTVTVINPGTLLWDKEPGFAIADFVDGTVQFYNLTPFTNQITEAKTFTPWTTKTEHLNLESPLCQKP
jgi:putative phosphoesterase